MENCDECSDQIGGRSNTLLALLSSPLHERWDREQQPTIAVLALFDATEAGPDSELLRLGSDIETVLLNAGRIRVVNIEGRPGPTPVAGDAWSSAVDDRAVVEWGERIGARYVVMVDLCVLEDGGAIPSHSLLLQVLRTESSGMVFESEAAIPAPQPPP